MIKNYKKNSKGFTLIELLIVCTIVALTLSSIKLAMRDGTEQQLRNDAQYLTEIINFSLQEAQLRNEDLILTIEKNKISLHNEENINISLPEYEWNVDGINSKVTNADPSNSIDDNKFKIFISSQDDEVNYNLAINKHNKSINFSNNYEN